MADPAPAPPESAPAESIEVVQAPDSGQISARDAAKALSGYRWERDKDKPETDAPPVERPIPGTREARDAEPTPTPEPEPPAEELEPIEPPRSWTKEWKEEFQNYPRDVQEKIAQREQERDTAIRRSQNEVAEQRKALEAERLSNTTARQQYEAALPALLQQLYEAQAGAFPDIRTQADVEKMAREDWARYAQWDAHQKKIGAIQQQNQAAQQRQYQEYQTQWGRFSRENDAKLLEEVPELSNPEVMDRVSKGSLKLLQDEGFSQDDISKLWNGEASVSLRDSRVQKIILYAHRYLEAKTAVPKAVVKPTPPRVMRPGNTVDRASEIETHTSSADKRLNETGNYRDAAELLIARRAGRR